MGLLKIARTVDGGIETFARVTLVFCICAMLFLTLAIIALRWFQKTYLWMDPLVRHLVFLSTFLGGVLATGLRQHIAIDVVTKYLEKFNKKSWTLFIDRIIFFACTFTLLWLAISSFAFVENSYLYEKVVFLGIHRAVLVAIIPAGFFLMAYRFFFLFLTTFEKNKS